MRRLPPIRTMGFAEAGGPVFRRKIHRLPASHSEPSNCLIYRRLSSLDQNYSRNVGQCPGFQPDRHFKGAIGPASIAPVVDPAGSSDLTIQCPPSLTLDKMNHFVERTRPAKEVPSASIDIARRENRYGRRPGFQMRDSVRRRLG